MCGIAMIASSGTEIPHGTIERMTECLAHRGPDGRGYARFPNCHLGHRRLSVIDLVTGDQPMSAQDSHQGESTERYWITFNGEIYNYRELRAELEKRGWIFRTQSDTEVLLRAYQEYGDTVPTHLNGQFAFAIWDRVEQRLFAARDRLGEKPLYWTIAAQGCFLAASEIKSLLASGLVEPRLDRAAVDAYLALLYVPPDRTIYENVHTLRPGHALTWCAGQWRTWSYWQPAFSQAASADAKEAIEQLRFLISQAVKRQMVADVPVGAFLSGGLDSSTIVALMTKHTDQPVMTFAVGFGDLIDELPYARAVAQMYHTDHYEIQMDIPVGEMLERMAQVYDEPFADSSNIPTYLVSEFAHHYVKVALSGDGGDELFGGYDWYRPLLDSATRNTNVAYRQFIMLAWRALARVGLPVRAQSDAALYAYVAASGQRRYADFWERHLAFITGLKHDRAIFWDGHAHHETEAAIQSIYFPEPHVQAIDRAIDFDVRCYLPGDILVKVDRAALAHGLETRAPFLDVDLVEFVWGLPWQLRFHQGQLKYLLREACQDLWPPTVQSRAKQGFGAPIWRWIKQPDVQSLWRRVGAPASPLVHLLPGLESARPSLKPQQVWTLLCLGLWLEKQPECLRHI
jgi:asparagine synthase (glutamine-hydrolysing)